MTTKKPRVVGTSRGTPPLTDDDIERLADEAGAAADDPSRLRPRGGRPRMGFEQPAEVVPGASRPEGCAAAVEARVDRRARSYQHMWVRRRAAPGAVRGPAPPRPGT